LFNKSTSKNSKENLGTDKPIGSHHYRAFVGPPQKYDLVAANQFNLLTSLGLREHHYFLDIGCGSLRGGRLFIPYLLPHRYFGIEPEQWLLEEGINQNCGKDLIKIKAPQFTNDQNFTLTKFGQSFDFILAQSIFSHASVNQIKQCLFEAKKVMKENSIFAATFVQGEKNNDSNEWLYPKCGSYTPDFLLSLVVSEGLFGKILNWPHPNNQTWLVIVKNENKDNIPDL
jgi:cyclopropane fatty-acyl-phospholipid synthase-like methyltransferase